MPKYRLPSLLLASIIGLSACSGDDNRESSATAPVNQTQIVFSPIARAFPYPIDLLFASDSDGTMSAGVDPANPVISGIDALDGSSVLSPIDITFSASLDDSQTLDAQSFVVAGTSIIPNPDQNVFLLPLTYPSGDSLVQAALDTDGDGDEESVEVPTFLDALTYQSAVAGADIATLMALAAPTTRAEFISLDGGTNNILRITPIKPLVPKTKYLVVITGLNDALGNPVARSSSYELLRDPSADLSTFVEALGGSEAEDDANGDGIPDGIANAASLSAIQSAILGWERLASGYFGFMQTVFDSAGTGSTSPSIDNTLLTFTFTTGGTTDVLNYVTAPETFFKESITSSYKKDAIKKLVSGVYNVSGDNSAMTNTTDGAINTTLNVLLTNPTLPGTDIPNALYNPSIAGAIAAGADFATIAADASAAYLMQRAATEAAIQVHNSGDAASGDIEPFVDIAAEAAGTVQSIAAAAGVPATTLFPIPAPRTTNFFRVDAAGSTAPAPFNFLPAPAMIYQGEITLPLYQAKPTASAAPSAEELAANQAAIRNSRWQASETVGGIIDAASGNDAGTTPPSDVTTYRYPFPTKVSDTTVPIVVTTPSEATLNALAPLGVAGKPANGWPVIVYVHGITADRSASLPMADALAFACVARDAEGNPTGASGAPCFATVAIDQPLHGIAAQGSTVPGMTSVTDPQNTVISNIGDNMPSDNITERHFDYTVSPTNTPMRMSYENSIGSSGSLFINLTNFTNTRDNLRQMVLDLLNVSASLSSMDLNDDGNADDLDMNNVYFIGHSLGAIDGLPFVAVNNNPDVQNSPFSNLPMIKAAAGFNTGGGVVRLLTNSPSFAPTILQGLAAANDSLVQGNSALETYMNVFQGVVDSVDVMNFASSLSDANSSTGVLLTETIGDQTIPNAADEFWGAGLGPLDTTVAETGFRINGFAAPLAGTEPLIAQFGAVKTADANAEDMDPAVMVTRFTEGSHSTPVSSDNVPVFFETLSQVVSFFALEGTVPGSIVTNTTVVEE